MSSQPSGALSSIQCPPSPVERIRLYLLLIELEDIASCALLQKGTQCKHDCQFYFCKFKSNLQILNRMSHSSISHDTLQLHLIRIVDCIHKNDSFEYPRNLYSAICSCT